MEFIGDLMCETEPYTSIATCGWHHAPEMREDCIDVLLQYEAGLVKARWYVQDDQ